MSYEDYRSSHHIAVMGWSFPAVIMAAMRQAEAADLSKLVAYWPAIWQEFHARGQAPGGRLASDSTSDIQWRETSSDAR